MITYQNIKKHVGQRFWKHIHNNTLISYRGSLPNREKYLEKLCNNIEKMRYVPSPPRGYVVSHKQNLVVRFIPTLTKEDYSVYFFCVKCLEDEIAKNRVTGTYGGWKLGGKIRKLENFDDDPSIPDNSYNKFAWKQAWTEYQKKAHNLNRNKKYEYFIVFDIANFYDSIRLGRLETLVREAVGKNKTQVVSLLFYFLSNCSKRDLDYEPQTIGLPQDEVGDCSRILANFYLQEYDRTIKQLCNKNNSGYLRYADDQIIASPDEKTAKKIMFAASKELAKLGLNLNASKARFFDRDEFQDYWSFDIFKLLEDPDNGENVKKAWEMYQEKISKGKKFKPETILKRLLSCNLSKVDKNIRDQILTAVQDKGFITNVNEYYLGRIYTFTHRNQKSKFLKYLNNLSDSVLYNQYHLRVMRFANTRNVDKRKLDKVKKNLLKLGDMVA